LYNTAKLKNTNITKHVVQKWLEKQSTYTMHKPVHKTYKRNKVVVSSINEQWQADLVNLQSLEKHNDGYKHLHLYRLVFQICVGNTFESQDIRKCQKCIYNNFQKRV